MSEANSSIVIAGAEHCKVVACLCFFK